MNINNIEIGLRKKPFIIAEMSGNHNQSFDKAIKIVESAAKVGVDAIKLQTYTADTITLNIRKNEFMINDKNSLWNGKTLYDLYEQAHTPWDWHEPIMKKAKELGILCFSSPFDETSVEFLEELNVPAYKIASPEIIHLPLIEKIASTGKPMIISTGMASLSEINDAVDIIRTQNNSEFALLKCTSSYPASPIESNIISIPNMRRLYDCEVGLSDHTFGVGAPIAAVAHGATIIEKHFTLKRSDGGVDSAFSLEPNEMELLVNETERAWQALGNIHYGATKNEKRTLMYRRSIYISENIQRGDLLNEENIKIIRPALGLPPKYYNLVIGKKIKRNIKKGTPLSWDLIL